MSEMGFWDVVKIKADEYSKTAAQKTNKFVEKTKRSITLTEYEDKAKNLYALVGQTVYNAKKQGEDEPDLESVFAQIDELNKQIENLKVEIDNLNA